MMNNRIGALRAFALVVATCVLGSCENPILSKVQAAVPTPMPGISLASGTYADSRAITLSCGIDGATIRYTTDGSDPVSSATAIAYSDPIQLNYDCDLRVAAKAGMRGWSSCASAQYAFTYSSWGLDPNFNSSRHCGYVRLNEQAGFELWIWNSAALQSDGKIVVLGPGLVEDPSDSDHPLSYPCVARFTASGDLDTTFGTGGFSLVKTGDAYCYGEGQSIAVDKQDRIYFQGFASKDNEENGSIKGFVGRLLANGTLDASYGSSGLFMTPTETSSAVYWGTHLLAVDPNSCEAYLAVQDNIYKVKADGTSDTAFGTSGFVTASGTGANAGVSVGLVYSLALKSSELVFSTVTVDEPHSSCLLGVGAADGSLGAVKCVIAMPSTVLEESPTDFAIAADGSILVASAGLITDNASPIPDDMAFAISKVASSGDKIVANWGKTEGKGTIYNFNSADDWPYAIAALNDGSIVVGGKSPINGTKYWALWRLTSEGAIRTYTVDQEHFGIGGSYVRSIIVQPDGRFIAVGAGKGAMIARYLP